MKRERLIAGALALAALALFYALLFPKPQAATSGAPPLSNERGPEGLTAIAGWLRAGGIPVISLRDRYGALEALPDPAQGNLLITSLPQRLPLHRGEQAQLLHWIGRGNSLLILAAIDDTPRWAGAGEDAVELASALSHIQFTRPNAGGAAGAGAGADPVARQPAGALAALLAPRVTWMQPRGSQPLMRGVQRLEDSSELPTLLRHGSPTRDTGAMALAERMESSPEQREAVLWVEPQGAGQIILSAVAAPFSNAQIDAADNARLLANIVAWTRSARGRVIFDDAHQGLVDFYDAQAFFADPRLHHTLEWIVLVWLVWVLGVQTLRGGQPLWQPTAATTLMEASARFFAARVPAKSAARRLLQNFYDDIHRRRGETEDGRAPWQWLETQPRLAPESLARLRELDAHARLGREVSLSKLQTLLSQIRGSLS